MEKTLYLEKENISMGTLEFEKIDQPFFYYKFSPTNDFEEYRKLFAEEVELLNSKNNDKWEELFNKIQALNFYLKNDDIRIEEFLIHIDKNNVAWLRY